MNIILWVMQVILALHTIMGAVWKFSNPAQNVPSLEAIPKGVWLSMSVLELACSLCLILPAISKKLGIAAPIAASFIIVEMLFLCGLHIYSGKGTSGQMVYWVVVAAFCAFLAYGRFVIKPI